MSSSDSTLTLCRQVRRDFMAHHVGSGVAVEATTSEESVHYIQVFISTSGHIRAG